MGTRTVRLDEEAEKALQKVMEYTGLSVSAALKKGIVTLSHQLEKPEGKTPYEIYCEIMWEAGEDSQTIAPSDKTREGVREALRRKWGR